MKVETIKEKALHSWEGQRSENAQIQSIIDHGFWVEEFNGQEVITVLYGSSERNHTVQLPEVLHVSTDYQGRITVTFKINQ